MKLTESYKKRLMELNRNTVQLFEENYLYEELTYGSAKNINALEIILTQAKNFQSAVEGVNNLELIKKSFKVLRRLADETQIVKNRIRAILNFVKSKKLNLAENNAATIRSINSDIKKLESAYYKTNDIYKILRTVRLQLQNTLKNTERENKQVKKQEYIKKNSLDYAATQGIFKTIGKFLKTKLSKTSIEYINFYNLYVLLGMDFNTISKGSKKTYGHLRVIKHRLEKFIEKFIQTGELQKFIKQQTGLKVNFKNKKITLSTAYGSHSDHLLKKDVGLKR